MKTTIEAEELAWLRDELRRLTAENIVLKRHAREQAAKPTLVVYPSQSGVA